MNGAYLILEERERQIEEEGWTTEHDANHTDDTLALACVCYAIPSYLRKYEKEVPFFWPWDKESWKPTPDNRIKELVKARALIAAEIDRLWRMNMSDDEYFDEDSQLFMTKQYD